MTAPWWTLADQAEQDLILWEFLTAWETHRERCWECHAKEPCHQLAAVVNAILDWREWRSASSFAAGMRAMQQEIDLAAVPVPAPSNVIQFPSVNAGGAV